MNDRQESKLTWFQKVSDACKKYAFVYAGVPVFRQAVAQLDGNIADIVRKAQEQSGALSKGATIERGNAFDRMAAVHAIRQSKNDVHSINVPLLRKRLKEEGQYLL